MQINTSTHTHSTKCLQRAVSDFLLSGKCAWVKRPGVGGVLPQMFGREVWHTIKKWTQLDLTFCKNEGSIRSKTNEKGGQLDRKWRQKFIQNGKNWCKILKPLCPHISGTKCDRHKLIFSAERGGCTIQ